MQYLLLIYENESISQNMTPEQQGTFFNDYMQYTKSIRETGHLKAGDALESISKATTVKVRDGKTLTTDGPFAETREQLGGYYLVEAADLDEAIKLAARIPSAKHGSIEIRPVAVFNM